MKKEKYFKDELRNMFIGYAIVPAVIFTLVCSLCFMAVFIYGKKSSNLNHNRHVARELELVLTEYEKKLEELSSHPDLLWGPVDTGRRVELFETFYEVSNRLNCEADIYVMNGERQVLLSNRQDVPEYLCVEGEVSWGIFEPMNSRPGETAIRLAEGWKSEHRDVVLGRAVTRGENIVGYLVFSINSSQFASAFQEPDVQTIITDRFGWAYVSSNSGFLDNSNQILPELRESGTYLSFGNRLYLVSQTPVYQRLFTVYTVSDIQTIVSSLTIGGVLVIMALILMTVCLLISTKRATDKKTGDFYRILDVLEKAGDGKLDGRIQIESDNEFRIIADAYNESIAGLKRQMENNKKMAELLASSQNKQLESQFNPHFLFNTLENIRYMCKIEPAIAERMVFCLSNLLRYSLDASKDEVTLKEDLTHLENYLTILKYRFNRRLTYKIDVAPEALPCRIPKLVLQPMIENSVKYGFGNQEKLNVELKVYLHEGKLIMICRDDGVGIPPCALRELLELLKQEENRSRHSGLYNINRRIGILYGRLYGVEIRSTEGYGTTLIVTLPAHTEEMECCGY